MENEIEPISKRHASGPKRVRRMLVWLSFGLVLAMLLVACSTGASQTPASTSTASSASVATSTPTSSTNASSSSTPAASTSTTPTATASGTPSSTSTATGTAPSSAVAQAIKSVIQQGNQEEVQAFATQTATVMQDTATTSYYNQLVQDVQQMSSSGITAIKLDKLIWGDITLQGTNTAKAMTTETWTATFKDGTTRQDTAVNAYTLVLQNGSWKIQSDQQSSPQSTTGPTASGGTGSGSTNPTTNVQPVSLDQSSNWSGYSATGGTYTEVSATWTVPTVSANTSAAADATWVGIGGIRSTDLLQAGTDATVQGGQVTYEAWIETLPQAAQTVPLAVNAGDTVSASITQQKDGTWQIVIKDLTTSKTYQTDVSYNSSRSSAEWIEESPSLGRRSVLPLDNFGTVSFKYATTVVNGQQETIQQAGGQAITMSNSFGQALAQPSALGSDGESFSVTRTAAPSSVMNLGGHSRHTYP